MALASAALLATVASTVASRVVLVLVLSHLAIVVGRFLGGRLVVFVYPGSRHQVLESRYLLAHVVVR